MGIVRNKRKLAAIAAVATISYFLYYQYTTPPITYKIDSRLIEINDTLVKLSRTLGFTGISIYSSHTNPQSLRDAIPPNIYDTIEQSDIKEIHFNNDPVNQTAVFSIDQFFTFFRPYWYYKYSEIGGVDEDIVPSLEEAVRQQDTPPYFFCQKAEVPNWFFCTAFDP
ncbi:hypothetical protein L861_15060 [Litchfieldella anticariensis FP35 = DSM 16096]|uniref:Uncharacterized protein n=1 Tax=Litchfieldella anticariensis (strain DSM 16096 / CECT 5854 / CIP 108499 / LMG 22089 / FP35) TaxID=1121939 RepID=S2L3N8_LITA3|nr:hypothetical protein [Halomonas anticariensis]EPC02354.1 hypothetical protein L861_15060 [Halomonas anticariensis FP35 = DSM 16096]